MAFAFPRCWGDEERMNFLFQPFKDRLNNPLSYDSKMKFWKELILEYLDFSDNTCLITSEETLARTFERKGKNPRCLALVIQELQKDGLLTDEYIFRSNLIDIVSRQSSSWTSWSYQVLVRSPLKTLTGKVASVANPWSASASTEKTPLVINNNLKKLSEEILKAVRLSANQTHMGADYRLTLTKHELYTSLFAGTKSEKHFDWILLWLQAEKCVLKISDSEIGEVYKFTRADGDRLQGLSDIELKVLQIQHNKDKLEAVIANRQSRCAQYVADIKECLSKKNRAQALRILRKKKLLEKNISKEMEHVNTLDTILDEIYGADTTQFVLKAYEKGADALKVLNELTPLSMVDSAVERLSESLANNEEINEAMSSPVVTDDGVWSLEQELAELLESDKKDVDPLVSIINNLVIAGDDTETAERKERSAKVAVSP